MKNIIYPTIIKHERLGRLQRLALSFIARCSGWHGYSSDYDTVRIIGSLERRGLVEVNEFKQFRCAL